METNGEFTVSYKSATAVKLIAPSYKLIYDY